MALGAAGGVRIPNSVFTMLNQFVLRGASLDASIAAPRLQTTGTLDVVLEPHWPKETAQYLKGIGFKVQTWESSSVASAVTFDPKNGECHADVRGPEILGMNLKK